MWTAVRVAQVRVGSGFGMLGRVELDWVGSSWDRLVWVGGADIQVGERGLFSFDCGQSQDKTRPLLLKK